MLYSSSKFIKALFFKLLVESASKHCISLHLTRVYLLHTSSEYINILIFESLVDNTFCISTFSFALEVL